MQKNKKTKSHGKPSVNKKTYNESARTIGIDIETYGPKRPKPIMVYKIYCHYRKTLDHSKYSWAKWEKFSDDSYKFRMDSDNICIQLEKQYPNWYFSSVSNFVDPDTATIVGNKTPECIVYDIKTNENIIYNKITTNIKINTDKHKQQLLKEAGVEDGIEQTQPQTKRKSKKSKKS